MSEAYFDDDLPLGSSLDSAMSAASSGASSYDDEYEFPEDDFHRDYMNSLADHDVRPPTEAESHNPPSMRSSRSRGSRGRGSRGGASVKASSTNGKSTTPKWRSGQIPPAPVFDGDIESDPYCYRHYKKKLERWVLITREFLPPNEQALRAREQLRGEAELEFAEVGDERFNCPEGIAHLLSDLQESFGEKELFRQGGAIREFESIGRLQGETITSFVRRFRLLERKLRDHKVATYPEEARVVKLLDGLRLDERSTSALLLAAGNKYNMASILDAIKIQYPAGMSVTGIPLRPSALKKNNSKAKHRRAWHTQAASASSESAPTFLNYQDENSTIPEEDAVEEWIEDGVVPTGDVQGDDVVYNEEDYEAEIHDAVEGEWHDDEFTEAVEALTVTSKRLADITKARGFYQAKDKKGKGGQKSSPKGKGKGKSSSFRSSSAPSKSFGKGKRPQSKGKGFGKPSPTPTRANFDLQQKRLEESLCLGCGSADHFIRDCPQSSTYSAQLTTAGIVLDAQGIPVEHSAWVTSFQQPEQKEVIQLPALINGAPCPLTSPTLWDYFKESTEVITRNPKALVQYADTDAALMIADTGCQRQVAGKSWHAQRQQEIQPLVALEFGESCTFSFGPNAGEPSSRRLAYPAGIAGVAVMCGVSEVSANAPALFSRPAFEALGAVPDITKGIMYFRALRKHTTLYLSRCGHLAIRVDEWPDEVFDWPMHFEGEKVPDVWLPDSFPFRIKPLNQAKEPARAPPHANVSSNMAAKLAPDDGELFQGAPRCVQGSGVLRSGEHEASDEGPHAAAAFSSSNSHNNVEGVLGTAASDSSSHSEVPSSTRKLPAFLGTSFLRGIGLQAQHMRPVRPTLASARGRRSQDHHTQGRAKRQDTVGSAEHQGQSQNQGGIGRILGWLTAAIGTLAIAANATAVSHEQSSTTVANPEVSAYSIPYDLAESSGSQMGLRERGQPLFEHAERGHHDQVLSSTSTAGSSGRVLSPGPLQEEYGQESGEEGYGGDAWASARVPSDQELMEMEEMEYDG